MNRFAGIWGVLALSVCAEVAWAQGSSGSVTRNFYEMARRGNRGAVLRMLRNGYAIDSVDGNGNTALCVSMIRNDRAAYKLLAEYGADTNHNCTKKIKQSQTSAFDSGYFIKPGYVIGAAAIAGGVAAFAGGGGGGSGSSGDDGDSGGGSDDSDLDDDWVGDESGNGSDDDWTADVYSISAADFETTEYWNSFFLWQIGANSAYARMYAQDGEGNLIDGLKKVTVAVVDRGVNGSHSELSGKVSGINRKFGRCSDDNNTNCWSYSEVNGEGYATLIFNGTEDYRISMTSDQFNEHFPSSSSYVFNEEDYSPDGTTDYDLHGTHVAGIIAASKDSDTMHGVAFSNANIYAVKWDFVYPLDNILNDVVTAGAKVVNMSFNTSAEKIHANMDNYYDTFANEFAESGGLVNAVKNNVVMVIAAGNDGNKQSGLYSAIPIIYNNIDSSSSIENLFINVVSADKDAETGAITLNDYSNECGVTASYCIAAPGGTNANGIISTGSGDGYVTMQGTSMAAPVVSGSIALLMGAYPYMTPQEIVELIFESAIKSSSGYDEETFKKTFGQGFLDLENATKPQGDTATTSGTSVNAEMTKLSATSVVVPSVFKQALVKNMPQSFTVFDKYKRPFSVAFSSVVKTTHGGEKNFKNDLYNFSRHQPKKTVESNGFAFGFAPSSYNNNDGGMGIVDVTYENESRKTSFYFAENSQYSSGSYQDKALFNPYLAMNEAYGVENTIKLSDWGIKFGFVTGENGLYDGDRDYNDRNFDNRSYAFNSELSYQLTPSFNLTAVSGMLAEDDAVLGMNGRGALNIGDSNTFYAGLAMNWSPTNKWSFGGAYYHGWTDAQKVAGSMIDTSRLMSSSFALDGHYNLSKTNVVGLQVSSPLRIYNGHADFDIATGRDNYSDTVYRANIRANLKPSAREYKFALYHNRELSEDVLFKSEIAVRLNPDHQSDADTDYRAMFGLSWAF